MTKKQYDQKPTTAPDGELIGWELVDRFENNPTLQRWADLFGLGKKKRWIRWDAHKLNCLFSRHCNLLEKAGVNDPGRDLMFPRDRTVTIMTDDVWAFIVFTPVPGKRYPVVQENYKFGYKFEGGIATLADGAPVFPYMTIKQFDEEI